MLCFGFDEISSVSLYKDLKSVQNSSFLTAVCLEERDQNSPPRLLSVLLFWRGTELHPGLSAVQHICDWFEEVQTSQIVFFSPYTKKVREQFSSVVSRTQKSCFSKRKDIVSKHYLHKIKSHPSAYKS